MKPLKSSTAHFQDHIHANNLHHAYCLETVTGASGRESFLNDFLSFLETDLNVATKGNADFWQQQFDVLGIEEGRMIKELQSRTASAEGGRKVFLIITNAITHEAQNALLKVFEEPTAGTYFFILTPSVETLLPTLRSRFVVIRNFQGGEDRGNVEGLREGKIDIKKFITSGRGVRLEMVKPMFEEKDKLKVAEFIDDLIRFLSKEAGGVKKNMATLEDLLRLRGYAQDRSASVKMILEKFILDI